MRVPHRLVSGWDSIRRLMRRVTTTRASRSTLHWRGGGDQAVVKDCHSITYFGGKKEQTSKNTRVKARVKAEALREFIVAKDQVIIMGHKIADADCLGACMGIYRAAKELEKKAHIVMNEVTPVRSALCMMRSRKARRMKRIFS